MGLWIKVSNKIVPKEAIKCKQKEKRKRKREKKEKDMGILIHKLISVSHNSQPISVSINFINQIFIKENRPYIIQKTEQVEKSDITNRRH